MPIDSSLFDTSLPFRPPLQRGADSLVEIDVIAYI